MRAALRSRLLAVVDAELLRGFVVGSLAMMLVIISAAALIGRLCGRE